MARRARRILTKIASGVALTGMVMGLFATAQAATIRVTITNNSQINGFHLTPLYVAFHSAAFDAWEAGVAASPGLEALAEGGDPSVIAAERTAIDPTSQGGVIGAPGGFGPAPIIEPGETASAEFDVNEMANQFFTFLSMVLPSNDTFIGTDNALQLFDAMGNFLGNRVIAVTGLSLFDAGTEVLDTLGSPFVVGGNGAAGATEGGVISTGQSLAAFAGLTLANGQVLDGSLIDFLTGGTNFSLATITIELVETAEVPLPAAFIPMLIGLAGLGATARKRRNSTQSSYKMSKI